MIKNCSLSLRSPFNIAIKLGNQLRIILHWLTQRPLTLGGVVIISVLVIVAIAAPIIAPYDPLKINIPERLQPISRAHLFGTDNLGRDIFSRIIYGTRISLMLGTMIAGIGAFTGIILGLIAGFFGGKVDEITMRTCDMFLAFPALILAMALAASLGPSLRNVLLALAAIWWPWYARITRGQVLTIREYEYVTAVKSLGASNVRIIFLHVLPNVISPIIIQMTMDIGNTILIASSLGFLGFGAQPPTPEWGLMASEGRSFLRNYWWYPTFPGLAILITVMGFNLLGDGLRDFLDPRLRRAQVK
ncbi:MAG: nickel transporter permease [Candidatus Bipolaricaulia bacterium]